MSGAGQAIDSPGSEFRVNPWIMWKYNVDEYFLWQTTIWNYYDGSSKNTFQVPWIATDYLIYGDGSLFYPGEQKDFAGTSDDKGFFGPISSIRMKAWRRGAQDYEYLWLARQRGIETASIVNSIVPRAFDDGCSSYTCQENQAPWARRGYAYENARLQLAQMLDESPDTAPSPPKNLRIAP